MLGLGGGVSTGLDGLSRASTPYTAYAVLQDAAIRMRVYLERSAELDHRDAKFAVFRSLFVLITRTHDVLKSGGSRACGCDILAVLEDCLAIVDEPERFQSLESLVRDAFGPAHPVLVVAAIRYSIQQNPAQPIDLAAYCQDAGLAGGALARLFRQEVGVSLLEYQRYVRLHEALRMLAADDTKVEAVALSVHVTKRLLYKYVGGCLGVTPTQFRRLPATQRLEHLTRFEQAADDVQSLRMLMCRAHGGLAPG